MANGTGVTNGNGNIKTTMVISSGVLLALATVMVNLFLAVQRDASVALNVVEQHGAELVAVRQELALLRDSMRDMTADRYKGADAKRDLGYLTQRLDRIDEDIKELKGD